MTITNETIIKAARAAGIEVWPCLITKKPAILDMKGGSTFFDPLHNDTDNAMIRRGAEIDVEWTTPAEQVDAYAYINDYQDSILRSVEYGDDKARAEREAVILCAAAKWDAMNSTDPDDSDINQVHEGNAMQGEKA